MTCKTTIFEGRHIDTSSREWQLICLARHICRMPDKAARNAFVSKLKKWPPAEVDNLRELVKGEWKRMYASASQVKEAAHDDA